MSLRRKMSFGELISASYNIFTQNFSRLFALGALNSLAHIVGAALLMLCLASTGLGLLDTWELSSGPNADHQAYSRMLGQWSGFVYFIALLVAVVGAIFSYLLVMAAFRLLGSRSLNENLTIGKTLSMMVGKFWRFIGVWVVVSIKILFAGIPLFLAVVATGLVPEAGALNYIGMTLCIVLIATCAVGWAYYALGLVLSSCVVAMEDKGVFDSVSQSQKLMVGARLKFIGVSIVAAVITWLCGGIVGFVGSLLGAVPRVIVLELLGMVLFGVSPAVLVPIYFSQRFANEGPDVDRLADQFDDAAL